MESRQDAYLVRCGVDSLPNPSGYIARRRRAKSAWILESSTALDTEMDKWSIRLSSKGGSTIVVHVTFFVERRGRSWSRSVLHIQRATDAGNTYAETFAVDVEDKLYSELPSKTSAADILELDIRRGMYSLCLYPVIAHECTCYHVILPTKVPDLGHISAGFVVAFVSSTLMRHYEYKMAALTARHQTYDILSNKDYRQ